MVSGVDDLSGDGGDGVVVDDDDDDDDDDGFIVMNYPSTLAYRKNGKISQFMKSWSVVKMMVAVMIMMMMIILMLMMTTVMDDDGFIIMNCPSTLAKRKYGKISQLMKS